MQIRKPDVNDDKCLIRKHFRYRSYVFGPFSVHIHQQKEIYENFFFTLKILYLSLIFVRQNETPADLARAAGHRELAVFIDSYPAIHPGSFPFGTVT